MSPTPGSLPSSVGSLVNVHDFFTRRHEPRPRHIAGTVFWFLVGVLVGLLL